MEGSAIWIARRLESKGKKRRPIFDRDAQESEARMGAVGPVVRK